MFSKQEAVLHRDAMKKKPTQTCSFNNLPVLKFWKKNVVQFLNGGFKLIIVFCKPREDKGISEVVMS